MKPVTSDNFGLLIAFLLPGFVTLWGAQALVPEIELWLGTQPGSQPTVGGFMYATLGSTAAGLIVSTIRWAVIDTLHHRTGIPLPRWQFRRLPEVLAAFDSHVQDHYRFYQFNANMLIAVTFAYAIRLGFGDFEWGERIRDTIGYLLIATVLYLGSRDTLRKYYERTACLLDDKRRSAPMR